MIDVSVIIVSYNTADLTVAAIQSVFDATHRVTFEVLVVDNDSSDGSADRIESQFPRVRLTRLEYNAGFAKANNLAAKDAVGRYILLLNPDTVVLDAAIDTLVEYADGHPEYGISGGSTFFANGSRNPTAGWNAPTAWSLFCTAVGLSSLFRGSRIFDSESLAWWDWSEPKEVDVVTGCLMMVERTFWKQLGGFDEQFHMYGEDADISFRAAAAGRPCILVPDAAIIHYGGASEGVRADKMVRLLTAKVQLFRKHWCPAGAAYAVAMLKLWAGVRSAGLILPALVSQSAQEKRSAWTEVFRRRDQWVRVAA